jgi:hypothetical protein
MRSYSAHRACAALVILPLAAHSGCFEEDDAVLFTGVAESTIKRMEQDEGFLVARGAHIEAVYKTLAGAGRRRRRRYSTPQVYKTSAEVWGS